MKITSLILTLAAFIQGLHGYYYGPGQMNNYYARSPSAGTPYNPYPFQNDAIIQMIRQYAPYQNNDEFGNKIMYQGYNGEQVLYKAPSRYPMQSTNYYQQAPMMYSPGQARSNQGNANYYQQAPMMYSPGQARSSIRSDQGYANYQQAPMMYSTGQARSSMRIDEGDVNYYQEAPEQATSSIRADQGYNPYRLPVYQSHVKQAYENTQNIPGMDKGLFKFLDVLSPYHFMHMISSDPLEDMEKNVDNNKENFVNPPYVQF